MTFWLDAHLSPALAGWATSTFPGLDVRALRDVGLRDAEDAEIFAAARASEVVVMTKDRDFVALLQRHGPPPQVLWVTAGNTSNAEMRRILTRTLPHALLLLREGHPLIEIR